jgi:hypothetical protein
MKTLFRVYKGDFDAWFCVDVINKGRCTLSRFLFIFRNLIIKLDSIIIYLWMYD